MEPKQDKSFIDVIIQEIEQTISERERGDFLRELTSRIKAKLSEREYKLQEELSEIQKCISNVDSPPPPQVGNIAKY